MKGKDEHAEQRIWLADRCWPNRPDPRRRGPAPAHAARLQLHGARSRSDRPRRLRRRHDARPLRADLLDAAEVGGDAGAARLRAVLLVPHAVDVGGRRTRDVLGLLRRDGPVDGLDLPGLHRHQHRAHLLHRGRHVRRHQPLRLHDQARPLAVRLLPDHGPDRRRHREHREPFPRRRARSSSWSPLSASSSSSG